MKRKRFLKRLGFSVAVIALLGIGYQGLLAFPQPFFPYRATYKRITLYSRSQLPKEATEILEKTDLLLSQSELYNADTESRIFVCGGFKTFWFYTGGLRHIFAVAFPHTSRYIFVPEADYVRDRVIFEPVGPEDRRRSRLSGTLAHEITHLYIFDYLGAKAEAALPAWIKEGYCQFVGQVDSIDPKEGIQHLLKGENQVLGLYYFRSHRMMELLIQSKGLNAKQILLHPPHEEDVANELMERIKA